MKLVYCDISLFNIDSFKSYFPTVKVVIGFFLFDKRINSTLPLENDQKYNLLTILNNLLCLFKI